MIIVCVNLLAKKQKTEVSKANNNNNNNNNSYLSTMKTNQARPLTSMVVNYLKTFFSIIVQYEQVVPNFPLSDRFFLCEVYRFGL